MSPDMAERRERILTVVAEFGSQKAFAQAIGFGESRISRALDPETISDRRLAPIERAIAKLRKGQNNGSPSTPPASAGVPLSEAADAAEVIHIPEVQIEADAGDGTDPTAYGIEEVNGELRLPAWYIRAEYGVEPARVRQIRTRGTSMEPTIYAGQRLLVALWDGARIQDGLVYVIAGPGGLQIKRLFIEEEETPAEDGTLRTRTLVHVWSDNPEAPRYRIPATRFETEYRVVAVALEINRKL